MPRTTGNVGEYAYREQFNDNYQDAWAKWLGTFRPELVLVGSFKQCRRAKRGRTAREQSDEQLAVEVVETLIDDLDALTVNTRGKPAEKCLEYLGVFEGLKGRYRDGGQKLKIRMGLKGFDSLFSREAIEFIALRHWQNGNWGFDCSECKWLDREFDQRKWSRDLIKDYLVKNPDRMLTNLKGSGR